MHRNYCFTVYVNLGYIRTVDQTAGSSMSEAYLVDAQPAQDYAMYSVTLGGNKLLETNPNPLVT